MDLKNVQKPARYSGGEWGSIVKDKNAVDIRFALCFPDVYEIGMSHLGVKILYHLLNERGDIYAERAFAPWDDFEVELRESGQPLYALESGDGLDKFDFVGFTLQYELSYTNILNMLHLGKIPLYATERAEDDPLVIGGGPCAYNAECLADFFDLFILGEAEEVILELMDLYKTRKGRKQFLLDAAQIEGVYVPHLFDVSYNGDGTVKSITANADIPATVKKRIVKDLDGAYYPAKMIVPFIDIVHDRIMLEIFRGCGRGCRFCQAGYIYRPVRERGAATLCGYAKELIAHTGYEEISLTSLSTGDYSQLNELIESLLDVAKATRTNIALPSLRLDSRNINLILKTQNERKSGFTFAPEAGTQRMRDIINKRLTEDDISSSVRMAFSNGWSNIKLYFMIGLPRETDDDVTAIGELAKRMMDEYYALPREERANGGRVTVSASSFVPKAFTPFQWEGQDSIAELERKQALLGKAIHSKNIRYNYHDSKTSRIEAVFARGDRRLGRVIYKAWESGCRLDGWSEFFDYDKWMGAFADCGIAPGFYADRPRNFDEILPWDHIDIGVKKDYLIREAKRSRK